MSTITCVHRKAYASEAAAWAVIYALRARNQDCERLRPQKCDVCPAWHLAKRAPGYVPDPLGGSAA